LQGTPILPVVNRDSGATLKLFAERLEPRRLLAAGDLDATFGTGGRRDIELTHPLFRRRARDPAPGTSDLLVVGQEIRRFHADGSLVRSFGGGDGVIPLPAEQIAENDFIVDAAVLPNGKVVVATSIQSAETFELRLFNADGSTAANRLIGYWLIKDVVAQSDGKILVLRNQDVMRFTGDLQPDAPFGTNGETTPKLQDSGFARASDGGFFAVGEMIGQPENVFILKYTSSGQPDTTFDSDGKRSISANLGIAGANNLRDLAVDTGSLLTTAEGKVAPAEARRDAGHVVRRRGKQVRLVRRCVRETFPTRASHC
jgi:hypothetical protein